MKLKGMIIPTVFACLGFSVFGNSQKQDKKTVNLEYRRSNLTMVLIEDNDLGKDKDMVVNAYNANPFPDKYNQHPINDKNFSIEGLKLSVEDYKKAGFYKDTLKKPMDFLKAAKKPLNKVRFLNAEKTIGILEPTKEEITNMYIDKYIKEKKVAKQLVANWLNRSEDGQKMDWEFIKNRGKYSGNFNENDVSKVFETDIDLIGNTFVVFNKMDFYANEPVARAIRDAALAEANTQLAGKPEIIVKKAIESINKLYDQTKEGYTVKCNTYLYQLDWNNSIAKKTNDYFFNNNNIDKRSSIWEDSNLYTMKFVGKTVSGSIVVGGKKSLDEIITLQVKRTMDNAMAKLQKEYIVFRPVSPVISYGPITAAIGLKEGVEAGQKYEVLVSKEDKNKIPHWEVVGKTKVDKKAIIWDNRIGAEPMKDEKGIIIPTQEFTTFKGGPKEDFMFIRLIK